MKIHKRTLAFWKYSSLERYINYTNESIQLDGGQMYQFEIFTLFAASIDRLYVFYEYLKQPRKEIANKRTVDIVQDSRLAVENLT